MTLPRVAAPRRAAPACGIRTAAAYVSRSGLRDGPARGAEPTWSPNGKQLAFIRNGEVVVARRSMSRQTGVEWEEIEELLGAGRARLISLRLR